MFPLFCNKYACEIDNHIKKKAEMEWDKRASDSLKALSKRVLPVLCRRFYNKGLMPIEIKRLVKDILNILGNGGFYNVGILNKKLERLGWGKNIVDNYIFELILYYFKYERTYKVEACIEKKPSIMGVNH
jgi:hypothetical protein